MFMIYCYSLYNWGKFSFKHSIDKNNELPKDIKFIFVERISPISCPFNDKKGWGKRKILPSENGNLKLVIRRMNSMQKRYVHQLPRRFQKINWEVGASTNHFTKQRQWHSFEIGANQNDKVG